MNVFITKTVTLLKCLSLMVIKGGGRVRKRSIISVMIFFICLSIPQYVAATSWVFPFVVWNDSIYVMTDEPVKNVGKKIGKVTSYSDMEEKGGNFSNVYQKGTAYYAIEGISTDKAIAVEHKKGQYIKANYESEYEYSGAVWDTLKIVLFALFVIVIGAMFYPMLQKRL